MLIWVRPSKIKKDSFLLLGHLNNIAADKMLLPNMKRRLDWIQSSRGDWQRQCKQYNC